MVVSAMSSESRRRDRLDIVAEILETAKEGAIKTHIMYKAKLSYQQLSEYIPMLVEKGFLENLAVKEHSKTQHLLKTTKLGTRFLKSIVLLNSLSLTMIDSDNKVV
jgi:predicted transcriptional regulator